MKVRLSEICLFDLNSQTVLLVSKFVREARNQEGADIRLTDPMIVKTVFNMGAKSTNGELKSLYFSLRRSLKNHFSFYDFSEATSISLYSQSVDDNQSTMKKVS